jgi:hypothetical protein
VTRSQDGVVLVNGPELMELQEALGVIGRACVGGMEENGAAPGGAAQQSRVTPNGVYL